MRFRPGRIAATLICCWVVPALAQPAPGDGGSTSAPSPPEVEKRLMPEERIQHKSLEDVLRTLNEKVPGFNSVVVRAPQVPAGYPQIDDLTPKNVTVGQFLHFLKMSFPGVGIEPIQGPSGPLYAVQIWLPSGANPAGVPWDPGSLPGMPPSAIPQGQLISTAEPTQVKVYRLDDIVASLAHDESPEQQKKALDDVLSLIQAALDQAGGKDAVVLKVHEPTQTLVFKGSPTNMAILEQVLATLQPKWVVTTGGNGGGRGDGSGGGGNSVYTASGVARMLNQVDRQNRELARQVQELSSEVAILKSLAPTTRPKE